MKQIDLIKKGWNQKDIKKAASIIDTPKHHDAHFSKIVFWSALIVIIFANLIVSLILIPFLIVLNQWVLYSIIILLAGMIGFLYNFLIMDIGHLGKKHHLLAGIIIPILAFSNILIMVFVSNRFIADLKVNNPPHDLWIISIIFVVAFILPYLIDTLIINLKK
ncbi:MAG: hypothetical protein KKH52_02130 [Nanoarchaeota archaeon]|nr:hypothetical protein [Nanoarchaeota archaeon]MBU1623090.1 hypothetical protein [Nanoarchaeota archaeon]MBU1974170.1 hypothetical protein [Nanoarchaeota archaeon]